MKIAATTQMPASIQKTAVVPGTAFGACGEGMIRASYASSFEKLELAVERMSKFLGK